MKGIVFAEFIEMVEDTFSPEIADQIINESDLASGGAYTSVGTYDHAEILQMVTHLSRLTEVPVADLVQAFGRHLCGRFTTLYSSFFEGVTGSYDFLETIENHVHVEVQKLYPDAELPHFSTERPDDRTLVMTYHSTRPFAHLAHGLIQGCVAHFKEEVQVEMQDLSNGAGNHARFTLRKNV